MPFHVHFNLLRYDPPENGNPESDFTEGFADFLLELGTLEQGRGMILQL